MSQPSGVLPTFLRNNCSTQPTSCTLSWRSSGRRERQLLCSQACSCTGLVVTEFTVSTGCQANWDFTMDKAAGFPFSGIFCRRSQFLFLCCIWQMTSIHLNDFSTRNVWIGFQRENKVCVIVVGNLIAQNGNFCDYSLHLILVIWC